MKRRSLLTFSLAVLLISGFSVLSSWFVKNNTNDKGNVMRASAEDITSVIEEKSGSAVIDSSVSDPYIVYYDVPDEWLKRAYEAPPEILAGSTESLLDYFFNSSILFDDLIARSEPASYKTNDVFSSSPTIQHTDYKLNAAYRELLLRADFLDELNKKAKLVIEDSSIFLGKIRVSAILMQTLLEGTICDRESIRQNYPYLQELLTTEYSELPGQHLS